MSCHTNEKPIDLPPSINLLTPMAPLIEQDDLIRETSCEVDYDPDDDDENNSDQQCGADYSNSSNSKNLEVTTFEQGRQDGAQPRSLSSKEQIDPMRLDHVPKLSVTMPSSHVIEISQTFYWPLYSRPIDWIYQENVLESCETSEVQKRIRKVAEELHSLDFFQPVNLQLKNKNSMNDVSSDGDEYDEAGEPQSQDELEETAIVRIMKELEEEKEDWFSDLSGGQKSKVELVRLVFIQDQCPDVLLVDETMAPLDPASKSLVMKKLKDFCSRSIIIVIYHTDVQLHTTSTPSSSNGGGINGEDCVPSNDFFDQNLHLEHGLLHIRPTC
jgi:ABC-type dipeptide/oligopeptide/nickel transport system ATPase component